MKSWIHKSSRRGARIVLGLCVVWGGSRLPSVALDPGKSVYQYDCRTWTYQTGMPANGVKALTQTPDGYLWLGTSRGLVRFDGESFQLVGLPALPHLRSSFVNCLTPSARGGLWFGLRRSSYGHYDGQGGWQVFGRPDGEMEWDVPTVLETEGQTLWLGGIYGGFRNRADTNLNQFFAAVTEAPFVSAFLRDTRGRVWIGTTEQGLLFWENGQLNQITNQVLADRFITSLAEKAPGQIWVGTHLGLGWVDVEQQWHQAAFPGYHVETLLVDRHTNLWIGTQSDGLSRWKNGSFTTLRREHGLAGDHILALTEDREGSLWVGTRGGLSQLVDVKLPMLTAADGLVGQSVQSVSASPRGGLWVCTDQGVNYWSETGVMLLSTEAGLQDPYVKRVHEAANGDLYVISGKHQIEIVADGTVVARHATQAMPVALTEDDQGMVVSLGGNLFRVDRAGLQPFEYAESEPPPLYWIYNLMTSRDGAIWVACVNGVARIKDGKYQHWSQQDGLPDYHCRWVTEDEDGIIWAGLATGISRLQDGKIRNFRREDGLLDGNIQAIMSDGRGHLWIDSGRGIYRVSRKELNNYIPGESSRIESVPFNGPESVRYSEKYGQEQSAVRTTDGRIWFPVAAGVVAVNPTQLARNPVPPPIYIRSVRGHHAELDVTVPAVLRPGENRLEFQYGGLSFIAPQKIQYAYQLIGHDLEWVDAGNRRSATYANLKPGQYEFLVKARNVDGVWSRVPASFHFEILPHYFQTAWFQGGVGLLTVLGLAGIYGWRMRVVRGREEQLRHSRELLEAKVRERTAELLRSNTFLTTEIEERKRMEAEVERIHRQLLDVSRQAGQAEVASSVLHNVGNVLNSVNVSTTLISDRLRNLRLENFQRAVQLLEAQRTDLGRFFADDPKGRLLPDYLGKLATHLVAEQTDLLKEVQDLSENVDHIKGIVAMQQNYARVRGITETVALPELVESAVKMHAAAYARHAVTLARNYEVAPDVTVDKHKVLQILVNILHNAKYACDESGRNDKRVEVRIRSVSPERVRVEVCDNGIGIAPEHVARLFSHGFTTRAKGHGFGLHSAALAAKDLGGALTAQSDGVGQGATFILEIPLRPPTPEQRESPAVENPTVPERDRAECDPARCSTAA